MAALAPLRPLPDACRDTVANRIGAMLEHLNSGTLIQWDG
jgi:hypothetical protein